jgi:membrane protein YqaA with SNARE-associated domain
MRANYYEYVRPQLGGEWERLILAEGLGQPEIRRQFLGYITVFRIVKGAGRVSLPEQGGEPQHSVAPTSMPSSSVMLTLLLVAGAALSLAVHPQALPYLGLFLTSLIAGTVLPFLPASSELAMAGLLATETGWPTAVIAAAIVGNIIGAATNYFVGVNIASLAGRRWFPLSPSTLLRTSDWFRRYGIWLLLLCWLPTFGDAITVVAGIFRANVRLFLVRTAMAKAFGHLLVASGVTLVT